jgi:hypothetical protein
MIYVLNCLSYLSDIVILQLQEHAKVYVQLQLLLVTLLFYFAWQEMEPLLEIQTETRPSSGIESIDTRVLSVEENNMLTPLLEKECSSSISSDMKYNSTWRGPKIEVAEYTRKMKVCLKGDIRVDRRIFILEITVISVCAGICVVLQHPHQVMEISMSLRRCLSGLRKAHEDISHP